MWDIFSNNVDLVIEFYTSLDVNEKDSHILEFQMLGQNYQLIYSFIHQVFGFKKDGMCDIPKSFNANTFWTFLTDLQTPFDCKKGKSMFIKDLNYWLLHKVLACVVFHKSEFNRVSIQEFFLMWWC